MKKIVLLVFVAIVSGASKGSDRWMDDVRGRYTLSKNAAELYFRILNPSVTIDNRQNSIRINRYGDFDIDTINGDKIYFSLMVRDVNRKGKWAVYRIDYTSDRKQKKVTKYVGVTIKGRRNKIIIGSTFDYKEGPSNPKNGITILVGQK